MLRPVIGEDDEVLIDPRVLRRHSKQVYTHDTAVVLCLDAPAHLLGSVHYSRLHR